MSNITPTFVFLSVALLLWSISVALSDYLAQGYAREHGHKGTRGSSSTTAAVSTSDRVKALEAEATANPESIDAHMALAFGRLEEAVETSNAQLIMASVQSFHRVLELRPEHPPALLGLATLCNQTGIIDKAIEYYERYLKQEPDDIRAKADFGLALIRGGKDEEAESMLKEVIATNPRFVPAIMSLAVLYRGQGNLEASRLQAQSALEAEQDATISAEIQRFIGELQGGVVAEQRSPAKVLQEFFADHPIVGPKLRRFTWVDAKTAQLELEQFPVEQMPPFAKAKFVSSVTEVLEKAGEGLRVVLIDSEDGRELMRIPEQDSPSSVQPPGENSDAAY